MGKGISLALLALLVVLPASGHASSARPGVACDPGKRLRNGAKVSLKVVKGH